MTVHLGAIGPLVLFLAACAFSGQPSSTGRAAAMPRHLPTRFAPATVGPSRPTPTALPTQDLRPTPEPTEPRRTRILFTGDINPGRCVAQAALAADDFTLPYREVADVLRTADITVGSLDGSITDRAAPMKCPETMNLNGPSRTVEGLELAGFDVITIATNHIKNCGFVGCWDDALRDTIGHLLAAGIAPVGGGESLAAARAPVVLERNGVRFAFLGASSVGREMWATETEPGTAPLLADNLAADIAAARQAADVVIVLPQWGSEYTSHPNWEQYRLAGQMMSAGATLVIGNQAHWVQAVEVFPHGVVAYALGNFVFDQGWSERTKQGVVFEAVFRGTALESWRLLPIEIHYNYQPRWAEGDRAAQILSQIEVASQQMLAERGAR